MILCHFSEVSQPFLSKHLACNKFRHANALDCLNFVQGLHSFMVSKCRKWHLIIRGTYLKIIRRGACHRSPLKGLAPSVLVGAGNHAKTLPLLVDRVGIYPALLIIGWLINATYLRYCSYRWRVNLVRNLNFSSFSPN